MAQIRVSHLTFHYERSFDDIFEDVSFSIDSNWKLGFLGRNGKGKTTFLKLLKGEYSYQGTIDTNLLFDYFPYQLSEEQRKQAAAEFLEEIKPGCEQWRVICELSQLSEEADILYRSFQMLSPGEQTKLLLAVLFSGENDFLLIDEPTNHLDMEARECVKNYLAKKKGFILVSHDRDLLDACTDHCLVLNRNSIEVQNGNFSSWWENKEKKDEFALAENEKHKKEIVKLKEAAAQTAQWARQNENTKIGYDPIKEHDRCISTRSYIAAKTKKLQSRAGQMEKRIAREIEEKEGLLKDIETPADLKLITLTHHKQRLVNIRDYSLGYRDRDPLFEGLSFEINQGDRIALTGKNGCGKSTLLKMILQKAGIDREEIGSRECVTGKRCEQQAERGRLNYENKESSDRKPGEPYISDNFPVWEKGDCEVAANLVISYMDQTTTKLKGRIDHFCEENQLNPSLFRTILRQLDFDREQFQKLMEEYSEGQKKKVLLAQSLLTPAHLYIWDEPLNYIDVFSRMQIEKLLLAYRPTLLFVEHDERFREKIAAKVISMDDFCRQKR